MGRAELVSVDRESVTADILARDLAKSGVTVTQDADYRQVPLMDGGAFIAMEASPDTSDIV